MEPVPLHPPLPVLSGSLPCASLGSLHQLEIAGAEAVGEASPWAAGGAFLSSTLQRARQAPAAGSEACGDVVMARCRRQVRGAEAIGALKAQIGLRRWAAPWWQTVASGFLQGR